MYIPFENLPQSARVWVYQCEQTFNAEQQARIKLQLSNFCANWESHNLAVIASFQILHDQFIVLGVDEKQTAISGCGIDKSVAIIKTIGQELDLELLDKSKICFLNTDNQVEFCLFTEIKKAFEQGKITHHTLVFNTSITIKDALTDWPTPAEKTWLSRFMHKQA